jgi:site-specific DNA recombinase
MGGKRAVLYARTSGDDRERGSLGEQLRLCRAYAEGKGYIIVAELAEDQRGVSGASWDVPLLNEALDMAQAGQFDVFIARKMDRLARDMTKQFIVKDELKRAGVRIEYVLHEYPDTAMGRAQEGMQAVWSQLERDQIALRMARGRRKEARKGNVNLMFQGQPCYGYRIEGDKGNHKLVIHEDEARIVRQVFHWYTQGDGGGEPLSMWAIARRLTEMRVPTQADKDPRTTKRRGYGEWSQNSVRNMLRNETYAGTLHYGRRRFKDPKKRNTKILNPREHWIGTEVPAIVSRRVWERAQRQPEENRKSRRRKAKYEYLLARRLRCAHCSSAMTGVAVTRKDHVNLYYYCPATRRDDAPRKCAASRPPCASHPLSPLRALRRERVGGAPVGERDDAELPRFLQNAWRPAPWATRNDAICQETLSAQTLCC